MRSHWAVENQISLVLRRLFTINLAFFFFLPSFWGDAFLTNIVGVYTLNIRGLILSFTKRMLLSIFIPSSRIFVTYNIMIW